MIRNNSFRGISLVEVMIAASCLALIGTGVVQLMGNSFRSVRSLDSNIDLIQIRKNIIDSISCNTTLSPTLNPGFSLALCSTDTEQIIPLISGSNPPRRIVSHQDSSPTRYGKWTIKAMCNKKGIHVYAAMPKTTNPAPLTSSAETEDLFEKDPGLGLVMHWGKKTQRSLSKDMPLCANELDALLDPSKPTDDIISTPRGQCKVIQHIAARTALSLAPDGAWRGDKIACPKDFPVAVSGSILPSCYSQGWNASPDYVQGTYSTAVTCSNLFYEDWSNATSANPEFLISSKARCISLNHPIDEIKCQAVCCNL